jgi:hypothetical protein
MLRGRLNKLHPNCENGQYLIVLLKLFQKFLSSNTGASIHSQFHFADFLVYIFHKLDDEIDEFVFEHQFGVSIGNQKADVIRILVLVGWLIINTVPDVPPTVLMGFLRKITKLSALCAMNLTNFLHKIPSSSSDCLILMLILRELIEPSTRTRSFAFLLITRGCNNSSLFCLERITIGMCILQKNTWLQPLVYCVFPPFANQSFANT